MSACCSSSSADEKAASPAYQLKRHGSGELLPVFQPRKRSGGPGVHSRQVIVDDDDPGMLRGCPAAPQQHDYEPILLTMTVDPSAGTTGATRPCGAVVPCWPPSDDGALRNPLGKVLPSWEGTAGTARRRSSRVSAARTSLAAVTGKATSRAFPLRPMPTDFRGQRNAQKHTPWCRQAVKVVSVYLS